MLFMDNIYPGQFKLEFFKQGGGCPDGGVGGYSADLVSLVSGEGALLI